jgi:hypothetical protein
MCSVSRNAESTMSARERPENVLIDYVHEVRLCLRTAATNGPIVHLPSDMWPWRAMVMVMPAGKTPNSCTTALWQCYQQRHLESSRRNGRRCQNFAYQYLKYLEGFLTCKILRHGTSGFTSYPKEGVLRIFIELKNPLPRPGLTLESSGKISHNAEHSRRMVVSYVGDCVQRASFV